MGRGRIEALCCFAAKIQTKIHAVVGRHRSPRVAVRRAWMKFYETDLLKIIEVFAYIFDLSSYQSSQLSY